ncbi:hypothetical protein N1030_02755 [Desulfovibrio mangrovi]|uniref:hypothetical protein n=1 Tax=Desulfovibrio mangrovi TaxID=2976983 RepID=UPI0022456F89|nr:hypothetical protein [Desulfovibrio mangrovi]UZP67915.1 hypothetical protein N1030_02755 [Desulfovibrio mangrovi]
MKLVQRISITLLLLTGLILGGCQKVTQGPTPLPEVSIGVARFTQPLHTWDLLAGYIPEGQAELEDKILRELDQNFETQLFRMTNRRYVSAGASARCLELDTSKKAGSSTALAKWINVGQCMGVDFLVVPQVLQWQDRDGGEAGTYHPAAVTMDIFIIDVARQRASSRFHFEETQESLANNLMNFSKFVERKGKWISAQQLAEEGMRKGIKELGL